MTDQPNVPPPPQEPRRPAEPPPPPPPPPLTPRPTTPPAPPPPPPIPAPAPPPPPIPRPAEPSTATAVIPPDLPPPKMAPPRGPFGRFARYIEENPWTNVYGLGRSIVAASTALTLLSTSPDAMWAPFFEGNTGPLGCDGLRGSIALFCIVPPDYLDIAQRAAVLVLALVVSGWRPRITGVLHWWISFSMLASATRDGGDQIAALVALFLIPWTLTDPREWHWQRPVAGTSERRRIVAHAARALIRIQVMVVYLHSAVTKFAVDQWVDGTAVYYWLHDPIVGVSPALEGVLFPLARSGAVSVMTFGAIVVEFLLVLALIAPRRFWTPLFWIGVLFHLGIAVALGLSSFSLAMIGALVLYLRAPEREFRLFQRR